MSGAGLFFRRLDTGTQQVGLGSYEGRVRFLGLGPGCFIRERCDDTLPDERVHLLERILGIGKWWAGNKIIELRDPNDLNSEFTARHADDPMWGRVILRSAQSEGGLESATAQAAWLDECGQPKFQLSLLQ